MYNIFKGHRALHFQKSLKCDHFLFTFGLVYHFAYFAQNTTLSNSQAKIESSFSKSALNCTKGHWNLYHSPIFKRSITICKYAITHRNEKCWKWHFWYLNENFRRCDRMFSKAKFWLSQQMWNWLKNMAISV